MKRLLGPGFLLSGIGIVPPGLHFFRHLDNIKMMDFVKPYLGLSPDAMSPTVVPLKGEKGMERETNRRRVKKIIEALSNEIPDSRIALRFSNPLQLLIATILSAQCTDVKVNEVTKALFKRYRSAEDYATADIAELEEMIRPTGFYRNKARSLQNCCKEIVSRFGGKVPKTLEELVTLPGVGRKTANVILGNAFGIPGITVDTHVQRVSQRMGLTSNEDPIKIEFDLMEIVPKEEWTHFSNLLIWHGRKTCVARKPQCGTCVVRPHCNYGSGRALV